MNAKLPLSCHAPYMIGFISKATIVKDAIVQEVSDMSLCLLFQILSDLFLRHINLGYEATSQNLTKHRALHLVRVTTHLSGRYSCKVSSNLSEDFQSKEMIIYGKFIILLMLLMVEFSFRELFFGFQYAQSIEKSSWNIIFKKSFGVISILHYCLSAL